MELIENGWVVINIGHPNTGSKFIVGSTFSRTRKKTIKLFMQGSGETWRYWREKYNFRVVKSQQKITLNQK